MSRMFNKTRFPLHKSAIRTPCRMRHALPQSRLTKPEQVGGNVYLFIPAVKKFDNRKS